MNSFGKNISTRTTIAFSTLALAVMFLLSTCSQLFQAGLGDKVDLDVPVIELLSHQNGDYVTGTAQIGGTFGDDTEITVFEVSFDGGETYTSIIDFDGSAEEWRYDFVTTAFSDGEVDMRFRVSDAAAKSAESRLLLYVDNAKPVVLIKNPSRYATELYNDAIVVRWEVADDSGISIVEIELFAPDGSPIQLFDADGNATGTNLTSVDGTNSWSFQFKSRYYTLASGTYSFLVTASDRAGKQLSYRTRRI